ncbi:MAG: GNAT family N-acetyltransferase [Vicinamibacterales bacterium]
MIRTSVQMMTATVFEGGAPASTNWQDTLPVIVADGVTLRELRLSDAPSLLAMLNTEEVSRFVSPPPTSVAGFERFIAWAHRDRAAGRFVCFGVVPDGSDHAIGIIQVRPLGPTFDVAEWGFAIGSIFWGRGVFPAAAREILRFTFTDLGTHRLEARSSLSNGRGNGALQKVGATREGVLRQSFLRNGVYHDQVIWSICAEDWRQWQGAARLTAH